MIQDYSTSKMSSSHLRSKNLDIANLLDVKPITKVTTKKIVSPENSGSFDSPVQMQPVMVEEEAEDKTPIVENNSSVVLSPATTVLNRDEIVYHVKNIKK